MEAPDGKGTKTKEDKAMLKKDDVMTIKCQKCGEVLRYYYWGHGYEPDSFECLNCEYVGHADTTTFYDDNGNPTQKKWKEVEK